MIEFKPSTFAAFANGVSYNIQLLLQSGLQKNSKVELKMPIKLRFDPTCSVIPKVTSCTIDTKTNKITILGLVTKNLNPGSILGFTIFSAGNPPAAMPCGSWEVKTQTLVEGVYY